MGSKRAIRGKETQAKGEQVNAPNEKQKEERWMHRRAHKTSWVREDGWMD